MAQQKDVVITGIGVVSPIGIGVETFWSNLLIGSSGIRELPELAANKFPYDFGGHLHDFDPKAYVRPRKSLKVMSRELQTAFSASMLATEHAGFDPKNTPPDRIGTVFGSEMLYGEPDEVQPCFARCCPEGTFQWDLWGESSLKEIFPLWMLKYLPNMAACHVGIALGALGPNNTVVMGDTSGLSAFTEAVRTIERGHADVVVTCSTGTRVGLTRLLYRGNYPYASRRDPLSESSRPFAADRDGVVGGEGAAAMVLETREHAEHRGATPIASVAGFANHLVTPSDNEYGSAKALELALGGAIQQAGASRSDIGIAISHAMGDPTMDRIDAEVHQRLVPDAVITAPKGATGHTGAACGIMELSVAALALQNGMVPPTVNVEAKDPALEIDLAAATRNVNSQYAVQSSHSAGGHALAVVLRA